MVISSDFRIGKHRDDDHEEDAPYFTCGQHGQGFNFNIHCARICDEVIQAPDLSLEFFQNLILSEQSIFYFQLFRVFIKIAQNKVGCVFPVVIWSEFCLEQHRDDDHREDAAHFTFMSKVSSNFPPSNNLQYSSSSSDRCVYLSISARAISSCDFMSCNCLFNLVIALNCLSTVSFKSSAYRNFIKRSFKSKVECVRIPHGAVQRRRISRRRTPLQIKSWSMMKLFLILASFQ